MASQAHTILTSLLDLADAEVPRDDIITALHRHDEAAVHTAEFVLGSRYSATGLRADRRLSALAEATRLVEQFRRLTSPDPPRVTTVIDLSNQEDTASEDDEEANTPLVVRQRRRRRQLRPRRLQIPQPLLLQEEEEDGLDAASRLPPPPPPHPHHPAAHDDDGSIDLEAPSAGDDDDEEEESVDLDQEAHELMVDANTGYAWDPQTYAEELQDAMSDMQEEMDSMKQKLKDLPSLQREAASSVSLRQRYAFLHDPAYRGGLPLEKLAECVAAVQQQLSEAQQDIQRRLADQARQIRAEEERSSRQCCVCMQELQHQRRNHVINCAQSHKVCGACACNPHFAQNFLEIRYRKMMDDRAPGPGSCPAYVLLHSCPGCFTNSALKNVHLEVKTGAYVMLSTSNGKRAIGVDDAALL